MTALPGDDSAALAEHWKWQEDNSEQQGSENTKT